MSRRPHAVRRRRDHRPLIGPAALAIGVGIAVALLPACRSMYAPDQATRAYPEALGRGPTVDVQVFRDGEHMTIVNATPTSYEDVDLWLNRRYVRHVDAIPAGGTVRLSLWEFFDERGERFNAGGLLRTDDPTLLRLAEIQTGPDAPLIGLVTIRAETDK